MPRYAGFWIATLLATCSCGGEEFASTHTGLGSGGLSGTGGGHGLGGGGGGTSGAGGSGGSAIGLDGGSSDSSPGCSNPTTWYPDKDRDSFGIPDGAVTACNAPATGAWVTNSDDCYDSSNLVYPDAPDYHDEGYPLPGGGVSFDYNCSGSEEPAPNQSLAAPNCTLLTACSGSGFNSTGRTGSGVNSLCGSHTFQTCTVTSLTTCGAVTSTLAAGKGYACR